MKQFILGLGLGVFTTLIVGKFSNDRVQSASDSAVEIELDDNLPQHVQFVDCTSNIEKGKSNKATEVAKEAATRPEKPVNVSGNQDTVAELSDYQLTEKQLAAKFNIRKGEVDLYNSPGLAIDDMDIAPEVSKKLLPSSILGGHKDEVRFGIIELAEDGRSFLEKQRVGACGVNPGTSYMKDSVEYLFLSELVSYQKFTGRAYSFSDLKRSIHMEFVGQYSYESLRIGNKSSDGLSIVDLAFYSLNPTHPGVRLNLCSRNFMTIQDRCPWNGAYELERKDIFLTADGQLLINFFCKNSTNKKWTPVGYGILSAN